MEAYWQMIMDITGCHITPHGLYIPGNPYKFILWNELLLIILSFAMTIVWLKNRALRRQLARERLRAYKHGYKPVNHIYDRIAHCHVHFEIVKKIIGEYNLIWLKYIDFQGNVTERTIEFHELFQKDGHWYIEGFCLLRCEARSFRVDRIIEIKPVIDDANGQHLPEYLGENILNDDIPWSHI
ncbi:MAG: WYL domain-containing protein [Spirochaetes bacterium]|nr:WYL domain-containing protein [Spirochaetota bacterium]